MLLPTKQRNDDPVAVVVLVAIASWAIGLLIGAIANGDEFRPRRRPRLSLEEPDPAPVTKQRSPAASPAKAAKVEATASAPGTAVAPADPRPLVIVYTVPKQCAPCRDFDRWAEKNAAKSPFRFEAREYERFDDLPAKVGTVPQFEFQGADGKRKRVNGWTGSPAALTAEYMRHNPEWKPTKRGAK